VRKIPYLIDMRKGFDGLALLVHETLTCNPPTCGPGDFVSKGNFYRLGTDLFRMIFAGALWILVRKAATITLRLSAIHIYPQVGSLGKHCSYPLAHHLQSKLLEPLLAGLERF
jgi:hypothetical protein